MDESSQSWYTKYRPKTMHEYAGDRIKKVVEQRFKNKEDFPHTILISGTRGCGKTTFARIISKYYLCENPHEDGTPCEECAACNEINEVLINGESGIEVSGVTEVDATIANGKESIQNIIDDAKIAPMYTKYKIIIFDECHMITPQAQNSLLKIVEDIPPHLVVIFATTNPEKVLDTIKSRCQLKLEARRQTVDDMAKRLNEIAEAENLTVSQKALEIIAKKGDRVPRECINLLESIAKQYDGEVTVENISDYLGDIGTDRYVQFFKAANSGLEDVLTYISDLRTADLKATDFLSNLMAFVMDAMYIKHGLNLDEYTPEFVKQIKVIFDYYESQDFDMLLQLLEQAYRDLDTDANSKKNEVVLTILAMRIGKIQLLASGLAYEQSEAIAENKISMTEHNKLVKKDNSNISEQLKMKLTQGDIKETFKDVAVVEQNVDILPPVDMSEIHMEDNVDTHEDKETEKINKEIDDFFSNDI